MGRGGEVTARQRMRRDASYFDTIMMYHDFVPRRQTPLAFKNVEKQKIKKHLS